MLFTFILATALITVLPGPSLILIVAQSLRHGIASGLWVVVGVVLADAVLLLLVCGGLGALLLAAGWMMAALKWLGIAWLAWLGIGLLRMAAQPAPVAGLSAHLAFRQGLLTTLSNPKIIGFLLVYFPQFLRHGQPVLGQMALLAPLFLSTVAGVFTLCALLAQRLQRLLGSASGHAGLQRLSGLSLLGCALVSALQ